MATCTASSLSLLQHSFEVGRFLISRSGVVLACMGVVIRASARTDIRFLARVALMLRCQSVCPSVCDGSALAHYRFQIPILTYRALWSRCMRARGEGSSPGRVEVSSRAMLATARPSCHSWKRCHYYILLCRYIMPHQNTKKTLNLC